MIIQAIRSLVFYLLFLGQTIVLAILLGMVALFIPRGHPAPRFMWAVGRYWGHANLAFLRYVVGIKSDVQGAENIPQGACIFAAKHQSDWDILALLPHALLPAFIAKPRTARHPVLRLGPPRRWNTISVDRKLGGEAIPAMLADATEKIAHDLADYHLLRRNAPRATGAARIPVRHHPLYQALNVPVVPVR